MPSERAHGVQIIKTCEAFAMAGVQVTLVVPDRATNIRENPFSYYNIRTTFPIVRLPVWDIVHLGHLGFIVEEAIFSFAVRRYVRRTSADVLYGRDERVMRRMVGLTNALLVWESHEGTWNRAARKLATSATRLVVISRGLKRLYVARRVPEEKIVVAHDGVDSAAFNNLPSPSEARKNLGLPEKPTAIYIGSLGGWKGTETFFRAAEQMPEVQCVVVGGKPHEVHKLSREYPKISFLGERSYREAPLFHAAGECIVIPNTARNAVSNTMTSPLKVFTALASGRPIIASDIPSLRDILTEKEAFFFTPDDPSSLAATVRAALNNPADSAARVSAALHKADEYSWDARARIILGSLTACAT